MKEHNKSHTKATLQSFILADQVYMDALTGKKVIAGTFDHLQAAKFPSHLDRETYAYLRIINCRGLVKIQLRYVDLENDAVLMRSPEVSVNQEDILASCELVMAVPLLPMPHPGVYELSTYCDGDYLGRIKITVSEMSKKTSEGK